MIEKIKTISERKWLSKGAKPRQKITVRTLQAIVKQSCKIVGRNKKVSGYTLRHRFATYLLESEIDLDIFRNCLVIRIAK